MTGCGVALVAIVGLALLASPLVGGTYTWTNGQGNAAWDTTSTNWTTGSGNIPWVDDLVNSAASFGGTGVGVVNLSGTRQANGVTLNTSGYTLSGGTLSVGSGGMTLASGVAASVGSNLSMSGVLRINPGASLTTSGNYTLTAGGNWQVINGTLNVAGGTYTDNSAYGLDLGDGSGNTGQINVSAGTMILASNANSFKVGGDNGGSGILTISGGLVDVQRGGLSLGYTTGSGTVNLNGGVLKTISVQKGASGTGNFNFNGGTLRAGAGFTFGSGITTKVQTGGATIDTNGFDVTLGNDLLADGSGGLRKLGAGTLSLTAAGNSTMSGNVTVEGGTLKLAATRGFDAGYFQGLATSYTVNSGATLEIAASWNTSLKSIYNVNDGTIKITSTGGDANYVNNLTMTGGSVIGATGIRTGHLTTPVWTINASGSGSTISAPVGLVRTTATQLNINTADGAAANDLLISGVINDVLGYAGMGIVKGGPGTLALTAANTYSGPTTVSAGTLLVGNATALGTGASAIQLNDAATGANNVALLLGGAMTFSRSINVNNQGTGTVTIGGNQASGTSTFSGAITLGRSVNLQSVTGDRDVISGSISGAGGLTKVGSGRLALTGTNTYGGSTIISAGILQTEGGSAIPDTSDVTVNAGTTWKLAWEGEAINGLNGGGGVQIHELTNVSKTLTVGAGGGTGTFSGTINNGGGTLSFIKAGSGTQTLNSAGANTMSGSVTINAGTLKLAAARGFDEGYFQNQATAYLVNAGGTLDIGADWNTSSKASYTVNGGTINISTPGDGNYLNNLTMTGGSITGSRPFRTGYFADTTWTINASTSGATISAPIELVKGTTSGFTAKTLTINTADGAAANDLVISGAISELPDWAGLAIVKTGAGTLTLTKANAALVGPTPRVNVNGGTLKLSASPAFDAGLFGGATHLAVGTGAVLDVASLWNIGSANIVSVNGGTLRFSTSGGEGPNYLNLLNLAGGTVAGSEFRAGNASDATYTVTGDSGSVISAGLVLVNDVDQSGARTVTFDVADGAADADLTVSGAITDLQSPLRRGMKVVKTGSGKMVLSATNTYTGATTVNGGTLSVTGRLANNGADKIFLAADTDGDLNFDGPVLGRSMGPLGDNYSGLGATSTGGSGTVAQLRAGTNASGQGPDLLSMSWRTGSSSDLVPGGSLVSDVLHLSGMENGAAGSGQADPFVLQMTYDETQVGSEETACASTGMMYLGWLGLDGWCNAVAGDFGAGASAVAKYQGTWDAFASANGITNANLASYLGSWGVDTAGNAVWAVLNHNSDFAALVSVPEPATLVLLVGGLLVWIARRRLFAAS
jgi:autotransporter-associated beta strand protein